MKWNPFLTNWFEPIQKLQKADKKFFLLTAFLFCGLSVLGYAFFLTFINFIDKMILARAIGVMPEGFNLLIWKMMTLVIFYRVILYATSSFEGISKIAGLRMSHALSIALFLLFLFTRFSLFATLIFFSILIFTLAQHIALKSVAMIFQIFITMYLLSKISLATIYQHIDFASALPIIIALIVLLFTSIDDKQKSR